MVFLYLFFFFGLLCTYNGITLYNILNSVLNNTNTQSNTMSEKKIVEKYLQSLVFDTK